MPRQGQGEAKAITLAVGKLPRGAQPGVDLGQADARQQAQAVFEVHAIEDLYRRPVRQRTFAELEALWGRDPGDDPAEQRRFARAGRSGEQENLPRFWRRNIRKPERAGQASDGKAVSDECGHGGSGRKNDE